MQTKKIVKQKLLVICAFVLGICISIYIKSLNPEQVYVPLSEIDKLKKEINYYKEKNKKLETLLIKDRSSLDVYENNKDKIFTIMKDELVNLKMSSGYASVRGNGVEVEIHDSEKDLKQGQNPNDLLVHDIDILKIINDLKKSGAEAISINGERIISLSEIKCSGPTITINGKTYAQPFIIKAIGNSDELKASLISPETYANLLKKTYGIYIDVIEKNDIFINSYQKHT